MIKSLTKRQLYDYHDIDPWELKLIRVGHALWRLYKNAQNRGDLGEIGPLYEALETVWQLKREYRAELAQRRQAKSSAMREKFSMKKKFGYGGSVGHAATDEAVSHLGQRCGLLAQGEESQLSFPTAGESYQPARFMPEMGIHRNADAPRNPSSSRGGAKAVKTHVDALRLS